MNKKCDACEFLINPNTKTQILETEYWTVGIGSNQAYFGRAYATLKSHKGSLSSLNDDEWLDFKVLVKKIESSYKDVFGAEPLNWSCCMNHAFREEPFNPHVHWHIYPRYKTAPQIDDVKYDDILFGNMYDSKAERIVSDEIVEHIASKLRHNIE